MCHWGQQCTRSFTHGGSWSYKYNEKSLPYTEIMFCIAGEWLRSYGCLCANHCSHPHKGMTNWSFGSYLFIRYIKIDFNYSLWLSYSSAIYPQWMISASVLADRLGSAAAELRVSVVGGKRGGSCHCWYVPMFVQWLDLQAYQMSDSCVL